MSGEIRPGQLIPPPGYEVTVPEDSTPSQRVRLWLDLLDACEAFLLAGLRREIGPDGDLRAAYQQWLDAWAEDHRRMLDRMAERFNRRCADDGQ